MGSKLTKTKLLCLVLLAASEAAPGDPTTLALPDGGKLSFDQGQRRIPAAARQPDSTDDDVPVLTQFAASLSYE